METEVTEPSGLEAARYDYHVLRHTLKPALKRGALIAAANWQVALVQATADSLFKLLIAAPVIGGIFLVALAVGADPRSLIVLEWRELTGTIVSSLGRSSATARILRPLSRVVSSRRSDREASSMMMRSNASSRGGSCSATRQAGISWQGMPWWQFSRPSRAT